MSGPQPTRTPGPATRKMNAEYWIRKLGLVPHPEGGYYREAYRSEEATRTGRLGRLPGDRPISTAIYFLLNGDQVSRLHRLRSDEIWHFYAGSSLSIHSIGDRGEYACLKLGIDVEHGQHPQAVVKAGHWFGATVDRPELYTLVGCTVAPGFDFGDLELADREQLVRLYPQHRSIIDRLTTPARRPKSGMVREPGTASIQLTNGTILIRPHLGADAEGLYQAVRESLAELMPWMRWCHPDYSIQETRKWIEACQENWQSGAEYNFVITDAADGAVLGGCGLNQIVREDRVANLGYWVRTSRTGHGAATAAALLAATFGFRDVKLNRIQILASVRNRASQRVAEKTGALKEGVLRNRYVIGDTVHDAVAFSLIPSDLPTE